MNIERCIQPNDTSLLVKDVGVSYPQLDSLQYIHTKVFTLLRKTSVH